MSPDDSPGFPGWFVALFVTMLVLMVVLGVGGAIWRNSVARKIARDSGLDPNTATAVTLLSNDGVGATYLASTLAARSAQQAPRAPEPLKSTEQRLRELQDLRARNLVSDDEYETQRQKILGSI